VTPTGEPLHIADQVGFSSANGRGSFDVSQNGGLVYFQELGGRGGPTGRGEMGTNWQWGWLDVTGRPLALAGETGTYGDVDVSPDGKLIAVTQPDAGASGADIWIIDWQQAGRSTRLTLDPSDDINPVWSHPSGDRVAFTSYRKGNADIYVKNANGTGAETPLLDSPINESIEAWSHDGRYIAYKQGQTPNEDIWILPLFGDKKPFPIVQGPFKKDEPQFSYDGKWLAYTSDESGGTFQVHVVSFPSGEQRIPVSKDGGGQPRWSENGKELFFRSPTDGSVLVADMTLGPKLNAGVPRLLFISPTAGSTFSRNPIRHQFAVNPNGREFLLRVPPRAAQSRGGGINVPFVPFVGSTRPGQLAAPQTSQQNFVSSGLTVIRNYPAAFKKEEAR
jgi:eukaryotic-like serine/threonine-protein kinase